MHSMKLFAVANMYFQTKTNTNITYERQKCFASGWAAIKLPPAGGTASGVREGRPASLTHNISRHTKVDVSAIHFNIYLTRAASIEKTKIHNRHKVIQNTMHIHLHS